MLFIISSKITHSFSSTQFDLPTYLSDRILDWSKKNILEADLFTDEADNGRETDPHVTVKYGLHTDDPDDVRDIASDFGVFDIKLGVMSKFESKDYDVLIIKVSGEKLHELNNIISTLKNTDTHQIYKPHITIAYLKKGKAQKFLGNGEFNGMTVKVNSIVFSTPSNTRTVINLS